MMTSKQIIRAAIDFTTPDRLPIVFDSLGITDIHNISWNQIGTGDNEKAYTLDDWGCGWQRSDVKNMGLVTGHPLSDWKNLDTYKWLDPDDPKLYEGMEKQFEGAGDKYIQTSIFMILFERMHSLRGFENTLMDFYLETEKIEKLADRIVDIQIGIIENISRRFPKMIDSLTFSDDWGTERKIFIRPELWKSFFKPRYDRIFKACKKAGWDTWLHSCGRVNEIIDDLIDIDLDVINLQQPTVLGIEEIGEKYAGKLCFLSLCDIQKTLPFKSPAEIEAEAILLMKRWGTEKGGFILGDYGDGRAIGVSKGVKQIMLDAFLNNDRWSIK